MKRLLTITVVFLVMGVAMAQLTPEQKKQQEKAERMRDSIMNSSAFKKAMKQAKAAQSMIPESIMKKSKEEDAKRKAKKAAVEKQRKEAELRAYKFNRSEIKTKENANSYYWLNKIASNTQGKFSNWSLGKADIMIPFYNGNIKSYLKIGEISNKGQVTISLPQIDAKKWAKTPITKSYRGDGEDLFSDIDKTLEYSNKNVKYFASRFSLDIIQGYERLGSLSIANSVVTNGNLNAPCCFANEGDGYIAYWVYMSEANTIKEKDDNPDKVVDTNLEFKKGWNIVITRVEGKGPHPINGKVGDEDRYWQRKYHTSTTIMPRDAKYYFSSPLVKDKY